jgi:uncharacterized protein YcsI (UPF0317 family)
MNATFKTPLDVRLACRGNRLKDTVASRALPGYLCVNIVMLDKDHAGDFMTFCERNPRPCPLLGVVGAGKTDCPEFAEQLDLRTDLGSYDVIRDGEVVEQLPDVTALFDDRMVTLLIGSSVSFDGLLRAKGMAPSHGPRLLLTSVPCEPAGSFHGPMVVTMRSFEPGLADKAAEYTTHFPRCHGGPLAKNDTASLGIAETDTDMIGRPIEVPDGHDRLYWACGVTPTMAAKGAKLPLMIVHTPGHAMITDIPTERMYE